MPRNANDPLESLQTRPSDVWVMLAPKEYRDWPEAREYFYDGELVVVNGKAYCPTNRPEWAQRMLHLGYEWEGEQPEDFQYDY